jgi:hypothetical protein
MLSPIRKHPGQLKKRTRDRESTSGAVKMIAPHSINTGTGYSIARTRATINSALMIEK